MVMDVNLASLHGSLDALAVQIPLLMYTLKHNHPARHRSSLLSDYEGAKDL